MSLVHASRTTTIAALATVLLLLPGLLGVAAGQTLPNVLCGQVLTSSTTLSGDIGPCEGDGLIIGASNITLDLNGHDVVGLEGAPQLTGDGVGILIDGHNNVTVTDSTGGTGPNGRSEVRGFDGGVVMRGGGGHTVEDLDILRNQGPASTFGAGEGEGIALWTSHSNTLQGNDVLDNGPWSGIGIYESNNNIVDDNKVNNNTYEAEPVFANQNIGIRVGQNSSDNTLTNNEANNNGLDGIAVFFGSNDNTLKNNEASGNARDGIHVWDNLTGTVGNLIESNTALGNGDTDLVDTHGHCLNNTWTANTYGTKNPSCIN